MVSQLHVNVYHTFSAQIERVKSFIRENRRDKLPNYLAKEARSARHEKWVELAHLNGDVVYLKQGLQWMTSEYYGVLVRETVLRFLGKQRHVQGKSSMRIAGWGIAWVACRGACAAWELGDVLLSDCGHGAWYVLVSRKTFEGSELEDHDM